MVVLRCPLCEFATEDLADGASTILQIHGYTHSATTTAPTPAATPAPSRGPKLVRPIIKLNCTNEEWNAFFRRFDTYKTGSNIPDDCASGQLLECTSSELGDIVLRAHPDFTTRPIQEAITLLKALAVVPVALGVLRSELNAMQQDPDETFRTFAAKVQGKAETCEYRTKNSGTCSAAGCGTPYEGYTYYTDDRIRDTLLQGIADIDIRREALSVKGIQEQPVTEIIAFVETRETARNANPSLGVQALSGYQRQQKNSGRSVNKRSKSPSKEDQAKTAACPDCTVIFHLFTKKSHGWNTKPHEKCVECWKADRLKKQSGTTGSISASDQLGQLSAISHSSQQPPIDSSPIAPTDVGEPDSVDRITPSSKTKRRRPRRRKRLSHPQPAPDNTNIAVELPHHVPPSLAPTHLPAASSKRKRRRGPRPRRTPEVVALSHQVFTKGGWRRTQLKKHPTVKLSIAPEHASAQSSTVDAVADSGAQLVVWGMDAYLQAGYSRQDLHPVTTALDAANKSAIRVDGAFFATITGFTAAGAPIEIREMVYVSRDVKSFYLSETAMYGLGMLSREFPTPGCALANNTGDDSGTATSDKPKLNAQDASDHPGPRPGPLPLTELPFPCTPENNERMKEFFLERFKDSVFDTHSDKPLPCMAGPPMEIHVDETVKPYACHTPAPVPIHWEKKVYEDLLHDEAIGVIERVPYGEPVTWCHRMVITRKHDGSPRRTVDLSPLNRHCKRETHSTESPMTVARRVPRKTWKTVTDAKNGFHSIPLRESDRHLTTFITPYGRWRYKRAVQGYVSSGDGFNRRFDAILTDFPNKERLMDDTLHYDDDLEEHWWRTEQFLTTCASSGVVLNPEKFQFAQREVDFAGCRITEERIDPLPKFFNAIKDFPTPTNATDIKSWFGLVNQVATYAQLRDLMEPFRLFLSPKTPFHWTAELDAAFASAKEAIIAAIRTGVEIFDPTRRTCLRPDWSIKGLGYFLLQKHCHCTTGLPNCCHDGWRITLAGSRFLQSAEKRYAPIEGEALAVAWGLEQTRFFTQGCDDLLVVTDHKPLVKILGDRTLDEIRNTRLFRLKQRTLPWRFQIAHLPGSTNSAADAVSRYPSPAGEINLLDANDHIETAIIAAMKHQTHSCLSLSWESLALATEADADLQTLLQFIHSGFPEDCPPSPVVKSFWRYRDALYESDGVVMYEDRVVVPSALRSQALSTFHAAHQGVSTMESRARQLVFWPGMTADFDRIRTNCRDCTTNAPSQPKLPPAPYDPSSTPFEKIVADFFQCVGQHYLVVADRLSGWPEVFKCVPGSPQSGAEGLISCLRNYFARFGVPIELASDGGPEFTAGATSRFLSQWGVTHRGSSAYLPQSNGRAEVAVKSVKRLLRSNVGPNGSLNTDKFLQAILQLRNTPDPDCHLSPAQVIFGRPLRDSFAFATRLEKYSNHNILPLWRDAWQEKESALRQRYHRTTESLQEHCRPLVPLSIGDRCYVQNQTGNYPKRWDRSGTIVDTLGHDSYLVKIDGSGRLSKRNRRFLRRFTSPSMTIQAPLNVPPPHFPSQVNNDNIVPMNTPAVPSEDVIIQDTPEPAPQIVDTVNDARPVPEVSNPLPPPMESVATSRHRRSARKPPTYEPESGKWVYGT